MMRKRDRARLLTQYVDARIARPARDAERGRPDPPPDRFDELLDLARTMDGIDLAPPPALEDALLDRLRREVAGDEPRRGWREWGGGLLRYASPGWLAARPRWVGAGVVACTVLAIAIGVSRTTQLVTAAEAWKRANQAEAALAGPGEVLHRRWKKSTEIFAADGTRLQRVDEIVDEWWDGDGAGTAAQGRASDGRLFWATTSRVDAGTRRSGLYLTALYPGPQRDVVIYRPTLRELRDALALRPPDLRRSVGARLDGSYLYQPVLSDRLANRALMIEEPRGGGVQLSSVPWTLADGGQGYRLDLVDFSRPWMEWHGDRIRGFAAVARATRFVDAARFLTVRERQELTIADGRRMVSEREILSTTTAPRTAADADRFTFAPPASVRALQIAPDVELDALADALAPLSTTTGLTTTESTPQSTPRPITGR